MQLKTLQFLTLSILYLAPIRLAAQIKASDSLALVDFYDSTNGDTWRQNINWKTSAPVGTWAGISVSSDRVVGITMYGNNASGTIPSSFKNLDGMLSIDLIDNGFRGDLLSYISNFKEITSIHIGEQYLVGPFPSSLGYLPKLTSLYIYGPGFNGPIPASFGNLTNLKGLDVSSSAHSGDIPAEELSNLYFGPHSLVLDR
jgi:Leucine-rich repeat (LRR) protein